MYQPPPISRMRTTAPRHPSRPSLPIQILLSDRSIIFVFFFVSRLFFAIGLGDDLLILVAGRRGDFAFGAKLFVSRFLNDWQRRRHRTRAAARGGHRRRLIGIALIRAAFRARRNRLAEVIELRVTAITGVL